MTENDPKNMNNDNFDKEFSLNRVKKTGRNGKIPSWIMILVGAAVITGVVAAKQPVIRPGTGTRASVNLPAGETVTVSQAFYNGVNDEKAASSELEARINSHTEGTSVTRNKQLFMTSDEQIFSLELDELQVDEDGDVIAPEENSDSSVYWIDEKPFALTVKPAEENEADNETEAVSSVYTIDDKEYTVRLEAVDENEIAALSDDEMNNIVRVGESSYRLDLTPAGETAPKAADAGPDEKSSPENPEQTSSSVPGTSDTEKSVTADDKPAEEEKAQATSQKEEQTGTPEESAAVAWLDEKPYSVTVKPLLEPSEEASKPVAVNTDAEKPDADEDKTAAAVSADKGAVEDKTAGNETIVIDPETEAAIMAGAGRFDISEDQTEQAVPIGEEKEKSLSDKTAVNVPVTVLDEDKSSDEDDLNVRTAVFEADGKQYEIRVAELDPADAPEKTDEQPVIWVDTVPLVVTLQPEAVSENSQNEEASADTPFEIVLSPVPEEEVPALYEERFGIPYAQETVESEPEAEPTAVISEPEPEPEEENWFVSVFHNIFGSEPTATPVPQVTVIAMTPTQAPVKPTATPLVVQFVPTATPQSPVRLDDMEGKSGEQKDSDTEDYSDWDDPALWEDENDTLSVDNKRATVTAVAQGEGTKPTATPTSPSGHSNVTRIPIIVVDPDDQNWPTLQPTPEELPQTGMAESWNIPSMLALLAGLLMIIIGVRRLRSSSR